MGESAFARGTPYSELQLCLQGARNACADRGCAPESIDGLVIPGGRKFRVEDIVTGLGVRDLRFSSRTELGGASSVAAIGHAVAAIVAGLATRVLIVGGWRGYSDRRLGAGGDDLLGKLAQAFPAPQFRQGLEHPYGLIVPLQYYALQANRWLQEFEIDLAALAAVSLACRSHAQLNDKAVMRGRPLTIEDYLASPIVSDPFRVLDCCLETDGAAAVIVEESGRGTGEVRVLAATEGRPDSPDDITNRPDMLGLGIAKAAPRAFETAGVGPDDIDFCELYDCFTFVVLRQLEEAGFCARGESPKLVAERGITLGGGLPVNTHGGLLSEAHVLGLNHVTEAVRQLRGTCGDRQVQGARIGLVTGYGDFGDGAVAVLGA
ncbi:MAG TPA: thiolase family protein [Streptosporangiaceae bacterium]